jgi:hypothetical protein
MVPAKPPLHWSALSGLCRRVGFSQGVALGWVIAAFQAFRKSMTNL